MFAQLKSMRIRTLSSLLIGLMVIAGLSIGAATYLTLQQVAGIQRTWDTYNQGAIAKTGYLSDLRQALGFGGFIHDYKNAILRKDKAALDRADASYNEAMTAIAGYRSTGVSAEEEVALKSIETTIAEYRGKLREIGNLIDAGMSAEAIDDRVEVGDQDALDSVVVLLNQVREDRDHRAAEVAHSVATAQFLTQLTAVIVGVLLVSLIAFFLWFAQSRLVRPIYSLMDFVGRIGKGDLTNQMDSLSDDEVGELGRQLNAMVANLKEITVQTRETVANLNSSATETLASTKQQAASVEQQFAAIQETTATLDEISQSGRQMSTRAEQIAGQSKHAAERSQEGLKAMDDMTRVMDAIEQQTEAVAGHIVALSEKTQAISGIIDSVNDIAERSQLLALNAAIEAASAGEEGRSFAVVADEMKTLADQAKEATGQVSSILNEIQQGINASVMSTEESVKRVANGRVQGDNTLKSIQLLASTIEESVRAFEQIVASTNQQRVGLEQVSEALQQIRGGSEQTSAGTRQIEIAVANINTLGTKLDHAMERYVV